MWTWILDRAAENKTLLISGGSAIAGFLFNALIAHRWQFANMKKEATFKAVNEKSIEIIRDVYSKIGTLFTMHVDLQHFAELHALQKQTETFAKAQEYFGETADFIAKHRLLIPGSAFKEFGRFLDVFKTMLHHYAAAYAYSGTVEEKTKAEALAFKSFGELTTTYETMHKNLQTQLGIHS